MEQKQPNLNYVNQSLLNQLANAHMQIAERDALITELYQELNELKKEDK